MVKHLPDVLQFAKGLAPTINGTKYVLIEFLPDVRASFVTETVHELRVRGFIPLIAHPERYLTYQRSVEKLQPLAASGAILQGTFSALLGRHGSRARQALGEMLHAGLIACLASDFHGGSYGEVMQASLSLLTKQLGQAEVDRLLSANPSRILAGEPVAFDQADEAD
jgi:protein-tyrosine phosphatase